jgi:hypothetical protein
MHGKDKNAHTVLFGKPKGNRPLGILSINLRTLRERMRGYGLHYCSSVAGSCEACDEHSGYIQELEVASVSEQTFGSCKCLCSIKFVNYKKREIERHT